ncbi:arylamine N-acetyltransferase family protein [Pseudoalteromonas luteoviolacea]|uniref:Arylamine N-acetyltransferase n=1 Tax=Pseudoalteromonas luteoviolacea (strain 2ta16) TaxID=1353533 RepID=V4HMQ7_PSEL2|nr:arylamine N-acetyltransferase [Pseudoalteromonas luteoviolacea]ESP91048.1 arylamine N-acetyltransferase [Pseudoalteromonas luteoviolacea 2ta16]KZN38195.1 hypothetical protein N483_19770 [Pseudoalteromonas luteoviolacea NCIMB 1944]
MNSELLAKYFNRINLKTDAIVDIDSLFHIHQLQHEFIPFENLDIIDGKSIDLSNEHVFKKLVDKQRGGYCYELNGLLYQVLKTIGFEVTQALGRVHLSDKPTGRGHLVNLVSIDDQQWVVDAGFGANTPRKPLPLIFDQEFDTDKQVFRFVKDTTFGVMLQSKIEDGWQNLYSLDMSYVCEGDIEYGNHFASTGSSSLFTSNIVMVKRTKYGKNILFNNRLKIDTQDETIETILDSEQLFNQALKEHFGIKKKVAYEKIAGYVNWAE